MTATPFHRPEAATERPFLCPNTRGGLMARVRYVGPDGGRNLDVARETGGSVRMVPGRDYDVTDQLAAALMTSSRSWVESPPLPRPAPKPVKPAKPDTTDHEEGDDGAL